MSNWNWSWIDKPQYTLKASESTDRSGGIVYTYRIPARGQLDAAELSTSFDSIATNINQQWRLWNSYIRPLIDSLPAGVRDQRWRNSRGLPTQIDALIYGVQGSTLFVFNDADVTKADGRYWDSTNECPKTIAEVLEDVWVAIEDLTTDASVEEEAIDLTSVWLAIGNHYQSITLSSASTSLDHRATQLESNVSQLSNDLYGGKDGYSPWDFGVSLDHSLAKNIDYILKLHNVSGWQGDPSIASHSAIAVAAHTHQLTEITPIAAPALQRNRSSGSYVSPDVAGATIYHDILRLRYEIAAVKGTAYWFEDASTSYGGATSLQGHLDLVGNGTPISTNPHGVSYADTGVETLLGNIIGFIGMNNYTDGTEVPVYSIHASASLLYIADGDPCDAAIGKLDSAIQSTLGTMVIRSDYTYDRSSYSESEREQTPITITHNRGKKPMIQVFDTTPSEEDPYGQYLSPTTELNIVHLDENTVELWTAAAVIEVILIG